MSLLTSSGGTTRDRLPPLCTPHSVLTNALLLSTGQDIHKSAVSFFVCVYFELVFLAAVSFLSHRFPRARGEYEENMRRREGETKERVGGGERTDSL